MRLFSLLFLIAGLVLLSCNYEKYKNKVQGNKGTFWDVSKVNSTAFNEPPNSYFLAVNGECFYYSIKKSAGGNFERVIDNRAELLPHTWKMRTDTLELLGADYLIYSRTSKLLKLVPLENTSDTLELIESLIQ